MARENQGGLKGLSEGRTDLYRIDPKRLHIKPGWNGRNFDDPDNQAHVETLANSIAVVGVKEPLTVSWEENKAWVTNGECRLRAIQLLIKRGVEVKTVPVQNEERFGNDADRLMGQVIRNSGKPFSPIEQASVFRRLLDLGWQQADIASKAGLSPSRVSQVLNLLTLPEQAKAMVTSGEVSAAMAQSVVASAPSNQAAVKTLRDAVTTARAEGKKKATPKHLNGGKGDGGFEILDDIPTEDTGDTTEATKAETTVETKPATTKLSRVEQICFDALFDSKVDDEMADEKGQPVVVITMSLLSWEKVRQALKL